MKEHYSGAQWSYSSALLGSVSSPQCLMHHITHYTQYIYYNIPSDWIVYNSPSVYMDHSVWIKSMSHFSSVCFSYHLNTLVLLYDGHDRHFDYSSLRILWSHHIHYLIQNSGGFVQYQPKNNDPNLKLDNLYGNTRMNFMRNHGTLKFTPAHNNTILVETWEYSKL